MPNTLILHPTGGTPYFGVVLEAKVKGIVIPGAPIVLKAGRHGPRGGFGVRHIWARHQNDLVRLGCATDADVATYVAAIVQPGSPVHCEFSSMRGHRVTVVRTSSGVAILEYFSGGVAGAHYSVVTAYPQKNVQGTRIGTIRPYVDPKAAAAAATRLASQNGAGAIVPPGTADNDDDGQ